MNCDWTGETQAKQKWHEWRGKGLGSSDAPVLMGVSPWKSVFKLWLEKTGQEESSFKGNWATERGTRLEPMVRDKYNEATGANMRPENLESPENPVWRASFDGIDHDLKKVIEIKCPSSEDHQKALDGQVPEKYYPQCQWLLMVSGYDRLDYVSYNDMGFDACDQFTQVAVTPDKNYIEEMKKRAIEFWGYVERRERPPETGVAIIDDPGCLGLLAEYTSLAKIIRKAEEEQARLLDQIKSYVPEGKATCGEYSLQWVERKGAVDYGKIPELKGVNLDQYRKPPTTYFTIKEPKR
jgi:putative phage-type endonuclease